MHLYPQTKQVLQHWSQKCHIAVASRTTYPKGADSALKLFEFDKYISYREIYPGCKLQHFKSLAEKTAFSFHDMLFFDDEPRNIRDVSKLGVECVLVDENIGVTMEMVEEAAKKFQGTLRN